MILEDIRERKCSSFTLYRLQRSTMNCLLDFTFDELFYLKKTQFGKLFEKIEKNIFKNILIFLECSYHNQWLDSAQWMINLSLNSRTINEILRLVSLKQKGSHPCCFAVIFSFIVQETVQIYLLIDFSKILLSS